MGFFVVPFCGLIIRLALYIAEETGILFCIFGKFYSACPECAVKQRLLKKLSVFSKSDTDIQAKGIRITQNDE